MTSTLRSVSKSQLRLRLAPSKKSLLVERSHIAAIVDNGTQDIKYLDGWDAATDFLESDSDNSESEPESEREISHLLPRTVPLNEEPSQKDMFASRSAERE